MAASKEATDRQRGYCWCWTHFDHDDCDCFPKEVKELESLKAIYTVNGGGFQPEKCPTTGKKHMQGWVSFDQEIIFSTLKKLYCRQVSWRKMNGTIKDNIVYCSKSDTKAGDYVAFGKQDVLNPHVRGGAGARNDLAAVIDLCNEGNSLHDVATTCPEEWIRYNKGIQSYHSLVQKDWVEQDREFIIMWGEAGAGKSWQAKRFIGEDSYFIPDMNNSSHLSFENYDGQKWILIEEFQGLGLFCDDLKRMTDRYKCTLRGRGCSKQGLHTGVIITSQANPSTWFPSASEEDQAALLRRTTKLYQISKKSWLNQLTGQVIDNPCPFVSQNPSGARTFAQLAQLPVQDAPRFSSGNPSITLNGKKRKLDEEFIDLR